MRIVIVGKKDDKRIVRWSRVVPLALSLSFLLGCGTGFIYQMLSGQWDVRSTVLGAIMGIVVVGAGLINSLKTPVAKLSDIE